MTDPLTTGVLRAVWIGKLALTVAGVTLFAVAFSGGVYPLSTTGTIMASVAAFAAVPVVDSVIAAPLRRRFDGDDDPVEVRLATPSDGTPDKMIQINEGP